MTSGFASVRCLRCGSPTEGGQFCASCIAKQRAEEEARSERVARSLADRPALAGAGASGGTATGAAGMLCPGCGRFASAGASFCGFCRFQFRSHQAGVGEFVYAGFWMRLLAWIIDAIILMIPNGLIEMLVVGPGAQLLLTLLLGATYFVGFWVWNDGATPGKMALGIKVRMADGRPIEVGPALLRWVGHYVSFFILFIGHLMIAFSSEKRGLHDNIAGTIVIKSR